jgi:hypothetical protein
LTASTIYASTITVTGLPSKAGYGYYQATTTFDNYCPLCGAHDTLIFHTGSYKGTYVPEGELSCTRCGADYCAVTGLDKDYVIRAQLIKSEAFYFKMPDLFPHMEGIHEFRNTQTVYSYE